MATAGYTSYHDGPSASTTAIPLGNDGQASEREPNGYGGGGGGGSGHVALSDGTYNDLSDVNMLVGAMAAAVAMSGFLVSLFFVLLEPHNRYIRFWAYQTMLVNAIFFVIFVILFIGLFADPRPGWSIALYVFLTAQLVIGVFDGTHAYRGARSGFMYRLPVVGTPAMTFALNAPAPTTSNPKIQMI